MTVIPNPSHVTISSAVSSQVRGFLAALRHPVFRGTGACPGAGLYVRVGRSADVRIGKGFFARRDLTLVVAGRLRIGTGLFCNRGVVIAALHDVSIGDQVRIGERVSILDHNHVAEPLDNLTSRMNDYSVAATSIGDRVLIGANSVIVAGARVGDDVVIGAGSVVRGEIPSGVLAAGVPARVIRTLATGDPALSTA